MFDWLLFSKTRKEVSDAITGRSDPGLRVPGLIYDGLLSDEFIRHCQDCVNDGFLHAVELRTFPSFEWYQTLKERTWYQTVDGWGTDTQVERKGTRYRTVTVEATRDESGYSMTRRGFLFLMDEDDWQKACTDLADLIVNERPFRTAMNFAR